MDPSQVYSTLQPIIEELKIQFDKPITDDPKQLSQQWNQSKISLDKLINFLSNYPSIIDVIHPIPNFSTSKSFNIPQSYSTETLANFNCVPYFIYNNCRDDRRTQILNNFCKLRYQINNTFNPCTHFFISF